MFDSHSHNSQATFVRQPFSISYFGCMAFRYYIYFILYLLIQFTCQPKKACRNLAKVNNKSDKVSRSRTNNNSNASNRIACRSASKDVFFRFKGLFTQCDCDCNFFVATNGFLRYQCKCPYPEIVSLSALVACNAMN